MPRFAIGQTIETRTPIIVVEPGLSAGRHRFQLVVFDEAGNRSRPATQIVEIQREDRAPTGWSSFLANLARFLGTR